MALVGFDITISCDKSTNDYKQVAHVLKQVFKKWCFQKEKGENTGYVHWQVRGHLWKATTIGGAVQKYGEMTWGGRWSITSKEVHLNNSFNYMMKVDTRLEGPWTDKDEEIQDPPVLTRQLKDFMQHEKYPWQQHLESQIKELDDRFIKLYIDAHGNSGKSIMVEYLEYESLAYEIPPMTCMEDIMQCAMGIPAQKAYCIDMPKGMKKEKLAGFYAGLEALKNGVMYDKRYSFKKKRIDRPQVIVFTNTMPDVGLLSLDRWVIFHVNKDKSVTQMPVV